VLVEGRELSVEGADVSRSARSGSAGRADFSRITRRRNRAHRERRRMRSRVVRTHFPHGRDAQQQCHTRQPSYRVRIANDQVTRRAATEETPRTPRIAGCGRLYSTRWPISTTIFGHGADWVVSHWRGWGWGRGNIYFDGAERQFVAVRRT
jgi:hypothetical protein